MSELANKEHRALKISDLSIGDWVGVRCGTKINAFKVEEIRFNNIIHKYVAILNNKAYGLPPTELHPIPITAELLEANGFEFEKASRWHICELEDKTRINVWIGRNNEGRIEVSKPDPFEDEYHFKYADIEVLNIAVHQLQHVLRLAGVDKEINL